MRHENCMQIGVSESGDLRITPCVPRTIQRGLHHPLPQARRFNQLSKRYQFYLSLDTLDETGICNQDQIRRSYAPKGQTPVLTQTGQKFSTSMIAAVSNRGLMRFKLYKGALNVVIFIDFLKRLIKDAKQKVFLIVDNLRVHHAKAVKEWLAQHKDEIEIFYLPAYAPEHNPDEYLNNDLKQTIKNKPRAKIRDDLVATTSSILKSIQRRLHRVKSYFRAKHVRYAA